MVDYPFSWKSPEPKPKDGIYFTSKNSEIDELQEELVSMKINRQKDAMKEIIAGMTLGKDVCPLLPYVVNCMRTTDIELKKLIYLYIINFAKAKPNESILAVNAFLTDAADKTSPMIRALAIRTMGCIRVDQIVTYLCDTLKNGLRDSDAYVKKTSCICVAKLFCTCPSLVKDNGLIDTLISLLADGNAIVLSSAIVALSEISLLSGHNYLKISSKTLKHILNALNEANEWGQIYILDCLVNYKKKKTKYAEMIIDAAIPLFSHINPSVILSAVKVVLKYLDHIDNDAKVQGYSKKLSMSLVTLMDSFPEMKWLLLRAMHCIIQKRHYLLDKDFKAFFIRPYEPIYVKVEKMNILYKLTNNKNYEMILNELKSYSMLEYDIDMVRRAIKYIGNIGFKFEKAMDHCVNCLSNILNFNQEFTIDQSVIVMRDLLRRYPKEDKPKELLKRIDEKLIEQIRLPESKCAVLFIIGEYAMKISKSTELITLFYNDFSVESEAVKLQILNACIKNFLLKPDNAKGEEMVKFILQKGAEEGVNPDVRDRAYFYWRLLGEDPDSCKEMMLGEKPSFTIAEDERLNQELCDDILVNITNMSCIYHKTVSNLLRKEDLLYEKEEDVNSSGSTKAESAQASKEKVNKINKDQVNVNDVDLLGLGEAFGSSLSSGVDSDSKPQAGQSVSLEEGIDSNIEFLDQPGSDGSNQRLQAEVVIFNKDNGVSIATPQLCFKPSDKAIGGTCGIAIYAQFHREKGKILLGIHIQNNINSLMKGFSLTIPPNSFCLSQSTSSNPHISDFSVNSEAKKTLILTLDINKENNSKKAPECPCLIEMNLKSNIDDFTFSVPLLINVLFAENGKMDQQRFSAFFKETNSTKQTIAYTQPLTVSTEEELNALLERNNFFNVARNMKVNPPCYYYNCDISNVIPIILGISYSNDQKQKMTSFTISVSTKVTQIFLLTKQLLDSLLIQK